MGRYDEAIAAYEKNRELISRGRIFRRRNRARLCADGQTARSAADDQRVKANPYIIAAVYAALGDKDEAFRILEKAVEERQFMTPP